MDYMYVTNRRYMTALLDFSLATFAIIYSKLMLFKSSSIMYQCILDTARIICEAEFV